MSKYESDYEAHSFNKEQNEYLNKATINFNNVEKHFENLINSWYKDELKHYAECYKENNPERIPTEFLKEHNYKDLRVLQDFFFWGSEVLKSYQKNSLKD